MGHKKQVLFPKTTLLWVHIVLGHGGQFSAAFQILSWPLYHLDGCGTLVAETICPFPR